MVEIAEFLNESNMSGKHRIMYNVSMKASASGCAIVMLAWTITQTFAEQAE